MSDEFELVPISPIRKLEKKIEMLENSSSGPLLKELVDVVKTNQKIVDDLVRINSSTIREISEVNVNLKLLIERLDSFLDRVDAATTEPSRDIMEKLDSMIEQNSKMAEMYSTLQEKLEKMERRVNALILTKMRRRA